MAQSAYKQALACVAAGLALCGCFSAPPSPQARATAEACGVFAGRAGTKQIERAAAQGQASGDPILAREARQFRKDLSVPGVGAPLLVDLVHMANRCRRLGFPVRRGW